MMPSQLEVELVKWKQKAKEEPNGNYDKTIQYIEIMLEQKTETIHRVENGKIISKNSTKGG